MSKPPCAPLVSIAAMCLLWPPAQAQAFDLEQCSSIEHGYGVPTHIQPDLPGRYFVEPGGVGGDLACVISSAANGGYEYQVFEPIPDHRHGVYLVYLPDAIWLYVDNDQGRPLSLASCEDAPVPGVRFRCSVQLLPGFAEYVLVYEFDETASLADTRIEIDLRNGLTPSDLREYARADDDARSTMLLLEGTDLQWSLPLPEVAGLFVISDLTIIQQITDYSVSDDPQIRIEIQWPEQAQSIEFFAPLNDAGFVFQEFRPFFPFVQQAVVAAIQ